MTNVKPKKYLGQHFLRNEKIALRIIQAITDQANKAYLLEIGPGTGVLTKHLIDFPSSDFKAIDLDSESIEYLKKTYPGHQDQFIYGDFLKEPLEDFISKPGVIIGNFPYNISSQIFFKVLDHHQMVEEVVCMLQKEVADRIAANHGNKVYGILSVLLQTFFDVEYLFKVEPGAFHPPPKVRSAVIRLRHKEGFVLPCEKNLFFSVVKTAFQKRRKTLRNALKDLNLPSEKTAAPIFNLRAEQLSVADFITLTQDIALWKS